MTAVYPAPVPPQRAPARLAIAVASRPLVIALVLTFVATALRLGGGVDSDVASQLWIAQRIHEGARLYRDIVEVNPPLWFWMAVPIERLAALLHLPAASVLIGAFGLLVALSLTATDRLLPHIVPARRTLFLAYAALILAAMPWMHVGQREQIVLIGALPYAALVAARREGRPVQVLLAIAVGAGAALGFALKHYFLIVPAALELWLLSSLGRRWRPFRPETLAIAGVGAAYAAALLVERDFLTRMVPLVRLAYGQFGPRSFSQLLNPYVIVGLGIFAFLAAHARILRGRAAPLATALFVAGLAFAATYFIQFKGWPYHTIPLLGCGSLALAALLAETVSPPRLLRILAPAILTLPLVTSASEAMHPMPPNPDALDAVAGLAPGDAVGFLTTDTAIPYSVSLQYGFRDPSRYNGIWMMHAVVDNELHGNPDPRIAEFGRQVVANTVVDFRCRPPRRIIAERPRPGQWGFDIIALYGRDPHFMELLSHYRVRSRTSVETYELVSPWAPPPPSNCRL
ncbi:MAG: hypothetical protein QOF05_34 [Sphingomonadales bacterium]|jgi:hypothetical protein|nr:hypothetical protein [Sphingomonadales bacterium]